MLDLPLKEEENFHVQHNILLMQNLGLVVKGGSRCSFRCRKLLRKLFTYMFQRREGSSFCRPREVGIFTHALMDWIGYESRHLYWSALDGKVLLWMIWFDLIWLGWIVRVRERRPVVESECSQCNGRDLQTSRHLYKGRLQALTKHTFMDDLIG